MGTTNIFKSDEKRDAIRARYNEFLAGMPFIKRFVSTSFGDTFVLEAGKQDAEPLILLHGSCTNSAFWFNEIAALSPMFHVFAVDIIGEAGNSASYRPDLNSEEFFDWLKETLRQLSVDRAVIAGNSLGSWLALNYAVRWPQKVSELVLFAPAGLSKQNDAYRERAEEAEANDEPLTLEDGGGMPQEIVDFINLILSGFNPIAEELPRYSDEEITRLTMPILMVAGAEDDLLDAQEAARHLKALAPQAEIHLLENTGHMILNPYAFMLPFFERRRTKQ
ncbi:MAG: alpha/beta hydrolase [Clostridiaceae bacterium]